MKKWIALLAVFVLLLSLAACGGRLRGPAPEKPVIYLYPE